MPRGGARNQSGPRPDPLSGRSARRGYTLTALPSEGYADEVPPFPLDPIVLFSEHFEERRKVRELDEGGTETFRDRESAVWAEAWSTPQACAWSLEPWRWPVVAEYCRLKTVVELDPSASAALVGQLHRYRDQIGLTPAGMRDNGWKIAPNEVGDRAAEREAAAADPEPVAPRQRRLRVAE